MFGKSVIFLLMFSWSVVACQSSPDESNLSTNSVGHPSAYNATGTTFKSSHKPISMVNPDILLVSWMGKDAETSLDMTDQIKDQQAEIRAEMGPIGQKITWSNPDTGNSGTILPLRDDYSNSGIYCREFQQSIMLNGQQKQGYGKACQQPDGSWKIAS